MANNFIEVHICGESQIINSLWIEMIRSHANDNKCTIFFGCGEEYIEPDETYNEICNVITSGKPVMRRVAFPRKEYYIDSHAVGIRLKKLLVEKGITQVAFAKQLGVTEKTVSNWCKGGYAISNRNVKRIAEALGVSEGEIQGIDDWREVDE